MSVALDQLSAPREAPAKQDSLGGRRVILTLGAVFVLYLLTYLVLWPKAPVGEPDSQSYLDMARGLSHGRLDQPSIRTPGYPLLLLALGSTQNPTKALFITGLFLHFLVLCMVVAVLQKCKVPRLAVMIAFVLLLLPYNVQAAAFVMTENLTEFALAGTACLLWWALRQHGVMAAAAAGAMIAADALIRPTYQLLWVALLASVWLAWYLSGAGKRCLQKAFLVMVVALLVVLAMLGGYCRYNQKQFGYFGLTYSLGINLSDKTALFVERLPESFEPLRSALIRHRNAALVEDQYHTATPYLCGRHWEELKTELRQDDVSLARDLARANAVLIFKHPLNYLSSVVQAAATLLFPYVTTFVSGGSVMAQALWSAVHFLTMAAFLVQLCFVLGGELWTLSLRWSGRTVESREDDYNWRLAYFLSLAIVVYTIVISAMAEEGTPRYRSPADALLLMNTALGVGFWWHRLRAARRTEQRNP